jgi:hypothetical protein
MYGTRYAVTQEHSGRVIWHADFSDNCFPELKYKCDSKLKASQSKVHINRQIVSKLCVFIDGFSCRTGHFQINSVAVSELDLEDCTMKFIYDITGCWDSVLFLGTMLWAGHSSV